MVAFENENKPGGGVPLCVTVLSEGEGGVIVLTKFPHLALYPTQKVCATVPNALLTVKVYIPGVKPVWFKVVAPLLQLKVYGPNGEVTNAVIAPLISLP